MLNQLYEHEPNDTLGLAGGCAHNSVWVGKIPQTSPFKKVFVAPASHDAGISVGAAAAVAGVAVTPEGRHWGLMGPSHAELAGSALPLPFRMKEHSFPNDEKLIEWLVGELCQKKIIGLYRGRMEFGPRALGSRSILADPRWAGMKDKLNARVKHREFFRPFAASVLLEHQDAWFANAFFSPAMEAVFEVKQPAKIPAVVHVDNTCRIQSVTKETQPFYWDLIEAFRKKTGIPMLLNTSFNDTEPIVCSERDVWNCFANTELDVIVVGSRAYTKSSQLFSLTG
jgi:carbamoyltransferase